MDPTTRHVEVARGRLARWVDGFAARHGDPTWHDDPDGVVLVAPDGATALLLADVPGALHGVDGADALVDRARPRTAAVLLVRRGGYAVGVARDGALLAGTAGTRYVQGRTAAGGWSQQRYQRRRENQAGALVGAAADTAASLLVHQDAIDLLVTGGDRALVDRVRSDPRLTALAGLPHRVLDGVGEPRRAVLEQAARRAGTVRVLVTDTKENPVPTSRELMPTATDAVLRLVRSVPAAAWERQSPCSEWSARDVLNHLTSEQLWVPHLLRGESLDEVGDRYDGDVLGDDPVATFERASEEATAALTASITDPQTETVDTTMGPLEIKEYSKQRIVDLVVHGWDIAKATATAYEPDPQAVEKALAYMRPHVEPGGTDGIFDAPVSTSSASRLDQLLALTGRDPNWRA